METSKASGPNSIPKKILKLFKKQFSKPLSHIINLSFNQGIFPNLFKTVNFIPIHKKGDKLRCVTREGTGGRTPLPFFKLEGKVP